MIRRGDVKKAGTRKVPSGGGKKKKTIRRKGRHIEGIIRKTGAVPEAGVDSVTGLVEESKQIHGEFGDTIRYLNEVIHQFGEDHGPSQTPQYH